MEFSNADQWLLKLIIVHLHQFVELAMKKALKDLPYFAVVICIVPVLVEASVKKLLKQSKNKNY
jgi:hypothetical protein